MQEKNKNKNEIIFSYSVNGSSKDLILDKQEEVIKKITNGIKSYKYTAG